MDRHAVLAAYDEQVRQAVTDDGWRGVTWSDLSADSADAAIAGQVRRFAGAPWEWKHYSHDQPADLPDRLVAAGFTPEPAETLLVAEVADLALDVALPAGVDLVEVVDACGVDALVSVHDAVFGGDHSAVGRSVLAGLAARPPTVAAVVAVARGRPVSAGRVEFCVGTDFAGLWGGGTLPDWRGRGLFRALVAHRAAAAAARGFRYLQVDASAESRPILERLGFVALAVTTPFVGPESGHRERP